MEYAQIIYNLLGFTFVAVVFLIVLMVTLKILLKNFNVKKKLELYGVFFQMDSKTILSFTLISFSYLFLVWSLFNFDMNYLYAIILFILTLVSSLLVKDIKTGIIHLANIIFECLVVYFIGILKLYVFDGTLNVLLLVIFVFAMIFAFLYFTYMLFRSLNSIVSLEKNRIKNQVHKAK